MIYLIFILIIAYFIILPIFYRLFEIIILTFFPKLIFRFGYKISEKLINFDFEICKNLSTIEKGKAGKFIFENDKIYIHQHRFWLGFFNLKTLFSTVLVGKIEKNQVKIKTKIPVFPVLHTFLGIILILGIFIWSLITKQQMGLSIGILIFLIFPLISMVQIFFIEEDNYEKIMQELEDIITTHNSGSSQITGIVEKV